MTTERLSLKNFAAELGSKSLTIIARYTSYVYAVSVFSVAFSGFVSTVFALFYFDAVNLVVSETFMGILKFFLGVYWTILTIQHGFLERIGISGFGKHIKIVNRYVKANPDIADIVISENLKDDEYKELFRSLVALPGFLAFNLFVWIFVLVVIMIILGVFLEGFNGSILFSIITIGVIALFNTVCFTMIASEILTGRIREHCKRIMYEKGITFKDRPLTTVMIKFVFFLVLLAISLYLSNIVTYYNHNELGKVISFAILAMIFSCLFAYMIFKIIYNALKQIESAAYDLMRGGSGIIFPRSLDKEFINLSIGLNKASKTILDYKTSLEDKVKQRTAELNEANEELIAKGEIARQELELAKNIQQGIIPDDLKPWNGISFATYYQPMAMVSGDYLDVFFFPKKLFVLMADVSGHGVPAAMITMAAKQAFTQVIQEEKEPAEIFKEVNLVILEQVKTSDYLSAFLLKIDEKNRVTFANAAHPHAVFYSHSRGEYQLLDTEGMFIGAMEEAGEIYENKETKLQSGDRIFLYTDGVLEHKNLKGEEFGLDRFIETLSHNKNQTLQIQVNQVIENLKQFMGNAQIKDDISMIAIELDPNWAKFTDLFNAGLKNLRDRNLQDALSSFVEASRIIPSFLGLQFQFSLVYFHLEQMDRAMEHITIYLRQHPTDRKALQLAISIHTKLGNVDEANRLSLRLNSLVG